MISVGSPDGARAQEVDGAMKAARVSLRPYDVLSWASLGAQSGALTGLAANAPVFSLRNLSTNLILVRRVGVGFILTTAFSTAQIVDFGLMAARSFTASDTGGTTIPLSSTTNGKHRSLLANPTSLDARIATTAALTAGTRTLDATYLAQTAGFASAVGSGMAPTPGNLFSHDTGDYPLVLAQNEGLLLTALTAFGSTGVGRFYANIEFAEVASF